MYKEINGGVCSALGYKAAAIHAGVKSKDPDRLDLMIVASDVPAQAAGVFTQNTFAAAPVQLCRQVVQHGWAQAIIANSGIANAVTGTVGVNNAYAMAEATASALNIIQDEVFVCSTGVIGIPMPMDVILPAIKQLPAILSVEGGHDAARAIMTTDLVAKEAAAEVMINGKKVTIGGMAKGSGMIHPNMATMLGFITTDAKIRSSYLQDIVKEVADCTFNMVSVDADTSTNDSFIVLANGLADNEEITPGSEAAAEFTMALTYVAETLARMMAADGEGASHMLEIKVTGAATVDDARKIARAISASNLVKAAFFGKDANWGRIVGAIGNSCANLDPTKVGVTMISNYGQELVMRDGAGLEFDEENAARILDEKDITILVELGDGNACATAWGCDLTYDYVRINGDYRT